MSSDQRTPPSSDTFVDRLSIDTPEQIQLHFAVAGIGSRFLAYALDTLIQTAAALLIGVVFLVLSLTGLLSKSRQSSLWVTAAVIVAAFLLYYGYFLIFEIVWNGQTPGKRKIGIRVIKDSGRPLTAAESIGRNLLRVVDQLPGFYAVGVLTAAINAQGKRLGDFVAGSIVVHDRSLEGIRTSWRPPERRLVQSRIGGKRLSAEEVALIETFLVRRYQLADEVRRRMAHDILDRMASKLALTDNDRAGAESTLEALVHEHRA
ncbi:MAG: RDD family protein [Acidobacteriaceae bacterium]|nr:RDD family protein [Acidobacteriaceae bacterium]